MLRSCAEGRAYPANKRFLTQRSKTRRQREMGLWENQQSVSTVLSDRQFVSWKKKQNKTTYPLYEKPKITLFGMARWRPKPFWNFSVET